MRVFISADIEGISGVCSSTECDDLRSPAWDKACAAMRADLDAALEGCVESRVDEVVVSDGHYEGYNLTIDGLPPGVALVSGAQHDLCMMQGISADFDAALFLGYHAMAGTEGAVLAHTWDGELSRVTRVDDSGERLEVGELGLNAAVSGAFGVPTLFVSGDDKLAAEAKALIPRIETAVVKEGISRTAALLYDPTRARGAIRAGVKRALLASPRLEPLNWEGCSLELEFGRAEWCDQAATCPGTRRLDGRRLLIPASAHEGYLGVYRAFVACAALAEIH